MSVSLLYLTRQAGHDYIYTRRTLMRPGSVAQSDRELGGFFVLQSGSTLSPFSFQRVLPFSPFRPLTPFPYYNGVSSIIHRKKRQ